MPSPADQLPSGPSSLAQKVARLERQVNELRASKRAAHTTVTDGKVTFSSPAGWQIIIDPTSDQPVIYFNDPGGSLAGAINATGDPTRKGIDVSSGPFSDGNIDDWRWVSFAGQTDFGDSYNITRARDSDPSVNQGGWFFLDADTAQLGLTDTIAGTDEILQIQSGTALFDKLRAYVNAPASSNPGLLVNTVTGHTGYIYGGIYNGNTVYTVDTAGNLATAGQVYAQTINIGSGASAIGGDLTIGGSLNARNIAYGSVSITPSAANTPTNVTVGGLNVAGSTFRAFTGANSSVPGTSILGTSASTVSSTGLTVWLTRANTTATTVWWMLIGE
jgi:hypothetical protein